MRICFSCLFFIFFISSVFAQQPVVRYQDSRVTVPGRTAVNSDRQVVMPYDVSPCKDVAPVFFLRVEDVYSITGVGTIAQGDVLEGKATVPTDVFIVEAARFWDVMLSYPKGPSRRNALAALRDAPAFSKKTILTSIWKLRKQLPEATKGMQAIGISLRGIPVADVKRGHYVFATDFPERFGACSCLPENSSSSTPQPRRD